MKNKIILIAALFAVSSIFTVSMAGDIGGEGGKFAINKFKVILASPITTIINPSENIHVFFGDNLNTTSLGRTINEHSADTSIEKQLDIDTLNLTEGISIIVFTNSSGHVLDQKQFSVN